VNASYDDITADIKVDPNAPAAAPAQGGSSAGETYEVKSGDTLSKIAKQYYGDANRYMDIFNANKDKLSDPNKIQVGQKLTIPAK